MCIRDRYQRRVRGSSTTNMAMSALQKLTLVVCIQIVIVHACVTPTGIDDALPNSITSASLNLPRGQVFSDTNGPGGLLALITGYETPIQFRLIQLANMALYSTAAAFHPTALDHFARVAESDARRRCAPDANDAVAVELNEVHNDLTLAYSQYFTSSRLFTAEQIAPLKTLLVDVWNVDVTKCDIEVDCDDTSTAWGLGFQLSKEVATFAEHDGWNADGGLARQYNKIPYQDFRATPYVPQNNPWVLSDKDKWQPLPEDKLGFQFHQEHVVPHIGETGRGIFMSDSEHCALTADDPNYDYDVENQLVLDRGAALTDVQKAKIELFDGKVTSIVPLLAQYYARLSGPNVIDRFEFIKPDSVIISVLYEAVMVVWREKIRHDRVRPPSRIHEDLQGTNVNSYAGANQGTQSFPAEQWEPYIRTMPHSEYPSASSCVCEAFRTAMIALQTDDVAGNLGGAPLVLPVEAGSSTVEENQPPAQIVLTFSSWSEIASQCAQSRLDGGMHYTASVPAGKQLCSSIGTKMVAAFAALEAGTRPDYVVDFFDTNPTFKQNRCATTRRRRRNNRRRNNRRRKKT
eukprot:TRINITY_DN843_c0_g1_i2.p1 TRINITY_DN843_c0_g1~~TRINITY_DN843_c0_g1_i2.p1  ORF type:complete len:575 (+),score=126.58 TRINITY_DN843_c0_g1_i2:149-1873(+)